MTKEQREAMVKMANFLDELVIPGFPFKKSGWDSTAIKPLIDYGFIKKDEGGHAYSSKHYQEQLGINATEWLDIFGTSSANSFEDVAKGMRALLKKTETFDVEYVKSHAGEYAAYHRELKMLSGYVSSSHEGLVWYNIGLGTVNVWRPIPHYEFKSVNGKFRFTPDGK